MMPINPNIPAAAHRVRDAGRPEKTMLPQRLPAFDSSGNPNTVPALQPWAPNAPLEMPIEAPAELPNDTRPQVQRIHPEAARLAAPRARQRDED